MSLYILRSTHLLRVICVAAFVCSTFALAGCRPSNQLETGYRYTPLGSTESQRRAFYADPFSADARRAEIEDRDSYNRNSSLTNPGGR